MKRSRKFILIIALSILIICIIGIKFIPFGSTIYKNNKMMAQSLEVPRLSIFTDECCMFSANFISFRSAYSLKKELDKIMSNYEKIICDSKNYYYDKENNVTIISYGIDHKGIIMNNFSILYDIGKYKCNVKTISVDDLGDVTIKIYHVSPTSINMIIIDKNEYSYTYNDWYKIEKKENEIWKELETKIDNYIFADDEHSVDSNDEVEFIIDWSLLYGSLEEGDYRIVKEINDKYIYIPFNIEKS